MREWGVFSQVFKRCCICHRCFNPVGEHKGVGVQENTWLEGSGGERGKGGKLEKLRKIR